MKHHIAPSVLGWVLAVAPVSPSLAGSAPGAPARNISCSFDPGTPAPANQRSGFDPSDPDHLILYSNSFWDTLQYSSHPAVRAQVEARVAGMSSALKRWAGLDDKARARQLQWALAVANEVSTASVSLILPPCTYDFSDLPDAHASTKGASPLYALFRPKLFIARNKLTITSLKSKRLPILTYSGPGKDGVHHGRVLLMVKSGLSDVRIENIIFQGDHATAHFKELDYYLHEGGDQADIASHGYVTYGIDGWTGWRCESGAYPALCSGAPQHERILANRQRGTARERDSWDRSRPGFHSVHPRYDHPHVGFT
jgi:hypothetical protein